MSRTDTASPSIATAPQTSLFVTGRFPRRRALLVVLSVIGGILVAYSWSAQLVDDQIGINTASTLLGHNAKSTPIGGIAAGVLFAFVSGLAGSFTACNIAVFGAVGPLVGQAGSGRARLWRTVAPVGWMAAGMLPVSAAYGVLVGIVGTRLPQFSTAPARPGTIAPATAQAMIAFGVVGVVMVVLGLSAAGIVGDPLAAVSRRFPHAPLVLMGALVGAFLVGRPYPLFRSLFRSAATTHNPLYGAVAFSLQSIGNTVVMTVLFVALSYGLGGRVQRWVAAGPGRASILTASAFLVAGVFDLVYWDLRVFAQLGYLWFPTAPWNG